VITIVHRLLHTRLHQCAACSTSGAARRAWQVPAGRARGPHPGAAPVLRLPWQRQRLRRNGRCCACASTAHRGSRRLPPARPSSRPPPTWYSCMRSLAAAAAARAPAIQGCTSAKPNAARAAAVTAATRRRSWSWAGAASSWAREAMRLSCTATSMSCRAALSSRSGAHCMEGSSRMASSSMLTVSLFARSAASTASALSLKTPSTPRLPIAAVTACSTTWRAGRWSGARAHYKHSCCTTTCAAATSGSATHAATAGGSSGSGSGWHLGEAEGDDLGHPQAAPLVEADVVIDVHHLRAAGVQQDVVQVAVPQPHHVPHHGHHRAGGGVALLPPPPRGGVAAGGPDLARQQLAGGLPHQLQQHRPQHLQRPLAARG
jgi:hypothetical protein